MQELINGALFAVTLLALILGLSSIAMAFLSDKVGAELMQERVEYGFFGVSGLVICLLGLYAFS